MPDEIASIYVEACLDLRKLTKELQDLQNKKYAINLDTKTNEKSLTELNAHLESKVKHLSEVNSYFARNPITPKVDDRQLTNFNSHLSNTKQLLEKLPNREITLTLDVNTPNIKKQIDDAVSNAKVETAITINDKNSRKVIDKLDEVLKSQQTTTKDQETATPGSNIGSLLERSDKAIEQAMKGLTSAVASPFKAMGTGLFANIGGSLGADLGKGLKTSIEKEFKFSFEEVGVKTGEFLGSKVIRNFTNNKQTSSVIESPQPLNIPLIFKNPAREVQLAQSLPPGRIPVANFAPTNQSNQKLVTKQEISSNSQKLAKGISDQFESPIKNAFEQIKVLSTQKAPNISDAKAKFEQIRASFSTGYKAFKQSLVTGNLDLARIQAESLLSMSRHAGKEIDAIKANLKASGVSSSFGSELATIAGSTKGVITSRYAKPTQHKINQLNTAESTLKNAETVGVDVVKGVTLGLKNSNPVVRQSSNLALSILTTMRKDLGIESPSKRAVQIGKNIVLGLISGIKNSVSGVKSAALSASTAAVNGLQQGIQKAKKIIPPIKAPKIQANTQSNDPSEFGTEAYFNQMYKKFGTAFKNKVLKGMSPNHADALSGEIMGTGLAVASMAAPGTTAMASLIPLLLPAMPLITAGMGLQNLLTPLIGKIQEAVTITGPITKRFEFLGGSKDAGTQEVNYARGIAAKYSVASRPALENYSQLAIAARGTKLEGEGVKDLFEGISASIRALNLGTYDSSLIFNAYTQILSKGKLSMEELRQQLGEKFPPAMNVFAKALGVSQAELSDLVSKGAILSEDILPKVAQVLKNDFGGPAASNAVSAMTRVENAGFDLNLKLADSFGGLFSGITNFGAGIFEAFNNNFSNIAKVAGAFLIGITAQVAVATQTIMLSPMVASKLGMVQNLFISSFKTSISSLTPFFVGVLSDIADDFLGAKHSVMENMFQGAGNAFTALFAELDNRFRATFDKGFFTPSFGNGKEVKDSMSSFFQIIPSGVVEMGALVIMFEQVSVLGKMLLAPMFSSIGEALKGMGTAFSAAMANSKNLKQSLRTLLADSSMAKGAMIAFGIAAKAALAFAVIAFARSDFSDPITSGFNKAKESIIGSIGDIKSALDSLKKKGGEIGSSITENIKLPSKGLELNPMVLLGLSEKSYKSDDFFNARNENNKNVPWFLRAGASDAELEVARKAKERAKSVGVGDFFTGNEKDITLSQNQLLNQATDLVSQGKELRSQLANFKLTPDTISGFISGDVEKSVKDLQTLDSRLEQLGAKRSKLALINDSKSVRGVRGVDLELNSILKERKEKQKPLQSVLTGVGDLKEQLKAQEDIINQSNLPRTAKKALLGALEPQKQLIEDSIKYLKDNGLYKLLEPLENVWQGVIDKLKDAEKAFDKLKNLSKNNFTNTQASVYESGISEPNKKRTLDILGIDEATKNQSYLKDLIGIREKSLSKLLTIPNVEQNKEKREEIDKLRENLAKDKDEYASNRLNLATLKNNLNEQLKSQTKQVAEYYRGIVRQVIESQLAFKKQINSINSINAQNTLSAALIGTGDNIVTQFVDSLVQNLQELEGIKNKKLDLQASLEQNAFQVEDARKQGIELSRSLPGEFKGFDLDTIDQLNNGLDKTVDIVDLIKNGTEQVDSLLNENIETLRKLNSSFDETLGKTNEWKNSLTSIPNALSNLDGSFLGVGKTIASLSVQTATWIGQILSGQGMMAGLQSGVNAFSGDKSKQPEFISQIPGLQGGIDAVKGFFNLNKGVFNLDKGGNTKVLTDKFKIVESVGTRLENVNSYADLEKHHPSKGREPKRNYNTIDGRLEEVRKTGDGRTLIKKDFVLIDPKGRQNVSLPSPAAGYVKATSNLGSVEVYSDAKLTQLVAKVLHLSNIKVKSGEFVKYGQAIGTQDGIGLGGRRQYAVHSHVELEKQNFIKYIADLKKGVFETAGNLNMVDPRKAVKHGGNDLTPQEYAKLTPQGKKLYELRNNKNILAIADAVARAEGTDFRGNSKNAGYGMVIGGENVSNLSGHPFVEGQLPYRNNSSASGRYQMMDFNYSKKRVERQFGRGAKTDLESVFNYGGKDTPGSFSPGMQDLYFMQSLQSRGVLDQVVSGQIDKGVLNKLAPHYASIQSGNRRSAYGGQGTPEGQHNNFLVFMKKRQELISKNPAMSAYMDNKFLTPDQLQAQVSKATALNIENIQQNQPGGTLDIAKSQGDIRAGQIAFDRKNALARRTFVRGDREIADSREASKREGQDLFTGLSLNKTPTESFGVEIQNKIRKSDDAIKDKLRKLEDIDETINAAMNSLKAGTSGELAGDAQKLFDKNRGLIKDTLTNSLAQYKQLQGDLKDLQIGKALDINAATKNFNTQEGFRQQKISFEGRSSDVSKQQAMLETSKAIIALNNENYKTLVLAQPLEEKKVQLAQIGLETEKAIADIEEKQFRADITSEQADKQIEQAKKLSIEKQKTLEYTTQLAQAQAQLNILQSEADKNKTKTDFLTESGFQKTQLEIDLYKSRGGNEFVANAGSRQLGKAQEDIRYQQELMDFETKQQQMKIAGIDIDPEALKSVRADMEAIHELNLDNINKQFKTFGMALDEIARGSIQNLGQGITGLIMGTKSLNNVLDEFFSNILSSVLNQGISSLLGGLFGGGGGLFGGGGGKGGGGGLGGLLGGLFYDGGRIPNYAFGGNLNDAFSKERSQSGKKPVLVVAHEGEMMIPAWRTNELASMGLGQKELLGYADGGVVGNMKPSAISRESTKSVDVKYQATVINNQSYVTSEQFEEGVRKAAQAGAEGGFSKVQSKLSNSSSFRRSVGF